MRTKIFAGVVTSIMILSNVNAADQISQIAQAQAQQAQQAQQAIQHAALISAWCYHSFLDEATPENMGGTA